MTIHRTASTTVCLLFAGALGLSGCAGAGTEQAPPAATTEQPSPDPVTGQAPRAESTAGGAGDESFSKSGVVMLLESQFGAFGGSGRWEGDALIVTFDGELDGGDGLELAFVCGFMGELVLETHTVTVETPGGATDCAASPPAP